jgi:hypothetical protein
LKAKEESEKKSKDSSAEIPKELKEKLDALSKPDEDLGEIVELAKEGLIDKMLPSFSADQKAAVAAAVKGKSLKDAKGIIASFKAFIVEPAKVAPQPGVPAQSTAGAKAPSRYEAGYKFQFVDNRTK